MTVGRMRWVAVGVFALYTALNYLDRATFGALGPRIESEYHLTHADFGWMQSAFSIVYALCAPFAGLLIDRLGLSRGAMLCISLWSAAAILMKFADNYWESLGCLMLLGMAQGGGIPGFGKAAATYLRPEERALGSGINQLGISSGLAAAPLLAGTLSPLYGWRTVFLIVGSLGFLWIPVWMAVQKAIPAPASVTKAVATPVEMLRDSRLWSMVCGNILVMTGYSLWAGVWTTIFLKQQFRISAEEVNLNYAWIPPIFAAAGGLCGGWIAFRLIRGGATLMQARSRAIFIGCCAMLVTAAVPYMQTPAAATALISFSFFWTVAVSANVYSLPQDVFGAQRTAFGVSAITFGYGIMQAFYAPLVGKLLDRYGTAPVCTISAVLPLAGWAVLLVTFRSKKELA